MICTRCVLPGTTPGITFDEEGICNHCLTYRKFELKGEPELMKLLEHEKQRENKYDCIVSISGGRDSSYTLLKLARDYEMNVLAVNYENPFTDPQARKNIENIVDRLGVDIIKFNFKNNIHERTFKNNALAWFKKPSPAMVPMVCIACKTIWWEILKIAKQNKIHCVISGGNPLEYTSFKKELLNIKREEGPEKVFIKALYGILRGCLKNRAYFNPVCLPVMAKGYLFGDPYALGSRIIGSNINRIDLFHYIDWNEEEIISRLMEELGWDYPKKLNSTWRFDCKVGHLKDLMYAESIKVTERSDFYAKMVREGKITREKALEKLQRENKLHLDEIESLFKMVAIDDLSFMGEANISLLQGSSNPEGVGPASI